MPTLTPPSETLAEDAPASDARRNQSVASRKKRTSVFVGVAISLIVAGGILFSRNPDDHESIGQSVQIAEPDSTRKQHLIPSQAPAYSTDSSIHPSIRSSSTYLILPPGGNSHSSSSNQSSDLPVPAALSKGPSPQSSLAGVPSVISSDLPTMPLHPGFRPLGTGSPSMKPQYEPSRPTPTVNPRKSPTSGPTGSLTAAPTLSPHMMPTESPTQRPSVSPTESPSKPPTDRPTKRSTERPTEEPTQRPSEEPTQRPTQRPIEEPTQRPTQKPTQKPTQRPTQRLTTRPTKRPSKRPTKRPTERPTIKPSRNPTTEPTNEPTTPSPTALCTSSFTFATYDAIDRDIASLKDSIQNDRARSHFLGGIVRLTAHDFMDYNPNENVPMGPDGCFDTDHSNNAGLDTIWCESCQLTMLHREHYFHISRADFWVAAANAIIRQTSVDNSLDLRDTFRWGRRDRGQCQGSGERLPTPAGCEESEAVFLERMGLEWKDVVALMGAHSLGRGDRNFSGHHGRWSDSDQNAQVFDGQYFEGINSHAWRLRNRGGPANGGPPQDWTTGEEDTNDRMMLNTDICLAFDIDTTTSDDVPCCTRIDTFDTNGRNECIGENTAIRKCPHYSRNNPRKDAYRAVKDLRNNKRFYEAFTKAWARATTIGQLELSPLSETCN